MKQYYGSIAMSVWKLVQKKQKQGLLDFHLISVMFHRAARGSVLTGGNMA